VSIVFRRVDMLDLVLSVFSVRSSSPYFGRGDSRSGWRVRLLAGAGSGATWGFQWFDASIVGRPSYAFFQCGCDDAGSWDVFIRGGNAVFSPGTIAISGTDWWLNPTTLFLRWAPPPGVFWLVLMTGRELSWRGGWAVVYDVFLTAIKLFGVLMVIGFVVRRLPRPLARICGAVWPPVSEAGVARTRIFGRRCGRQLWA